MEPYQSFEEMCKGLAAHPEAWAKVRDEQNYMPLLAVLEHPYSFVVTRLVEGLVAAGLPRTEVECITLRELVIFALAGPVKWGWGTRYPGPKRGAPLTMRLLRRSNAWRKTSAFRSASGTELSQ